MDTRLTRLPTDISSLLILYLTRREILHSPELLERYRDPHHFVWKLLYHRDLSTYPLTEHHAAIGPLTYRDQYFGGHDLIQSGMTDQQLASMGYDRVIKPTAIPHVAVIAIRRGYLSMIEPLLSQDCWEYNSWSKLDIMAEYIKAGGDVSKHWVDKTDDRVIMAAIEAGNVSLLPETYTPRTVYPPPNRTLMRAAGRSGRLDMVEYVLSRVPDSKKELSSCLEGAAEMNHVNVMDDMLRRGVQVNLDVFKLANGVEAFEWLICHQPQFHYDVDNIVAALMSRNGSTSALKYLLDRMTISQKTWIQLFREAIRRGLAHHLETLLNHPKCMVDLSYLDQSLFDLAGSTHAYYSRRMFWMVYRHKPWALRYRLHLLRSVTHLATFIKLLDELQLPTEQLLDVLYREVTKAGRQDHIKTLIEVYLKHIPADDILASLTEIPVDLTYVKSLLRSHHKG